MYNPNKHVLSCLSCRYVYLICFTGYLREQSRVAMDGASEEEKKTFALTGETLLPLAAIAS